MKSVVECLKTKGGIIEPGRRNFQRQYLFRPAFPNFVSNTVSRIKSMSSTNIFSTAALQNEGISFNMIYDSLTPHFYAGRFCYQFFIHLFFPFTIPLSPNPCAQYFVDSRFSVS